MTALQRKLCFGGLWLAFSAYAFLLAPPNDPQTLAQIIALSTGNWGAINPAIVALFNLMGVWPLVYGAVILADGHSQPPANPGQSKGIKAWPFWLASFGFGAFALLPYLAGRSPALQEPEPPARRLKILHSRSFGLFLLANALGWIAYALAQGDWANFLLQWQNSRFIHVMGLDFCLLTLLFPVLAQDDARRRGLAQPQWTWVTLLFPVLGAASYLCWRPIPNPSNPPA
jgi:hypothetical protein